MRSIEERFWSKVNKTDNCWLWQGGISNRYGQIKISKSRKQISVHRYSYELHYGIISNNLFVCHKCDNPLCVRPDHLFLGTYLENIQDMLDKKRHNYGSKHSMSKLNENDIIEIKLALQNPYCGINKDLANKYNVNHRTISNIKLNKNWKHV